MNLWIVAAAVVGAVVMLVALNLSSSERKIEHEIRPLYAVGDPQFLRSMGALLGPGIVGGNRVDALLNGDEIFPAMLEAIRGATQTITFETYIYWSGEIGKRIRRRALPSAPAPASRSTCCSTGSAAARWTRRCSTRWKRPASRSASTTRCAGTTSAGMNNRTHRKLLVVDGTRRLHRRRRHRRQLAGPRAGPGALARHALPGRRAGGGADAGGVHGQLDQEPRRTCCTASDYFPALPAAGHSAAQVFSSSPTGGSESMQLMYLLSIAAAEQSIAWPARTSCPTS